MKRPIIKFTKMHGLGNDFVVINAIKEPFHIIDFPIQKLSHRHTGIGFDQLVLIEPSEQADIACRFFNADGSEAEQCGNGLRCAARYVHENKLIQKNNLDIETRAGIVKIILHDYQHIEVSLGIPRIENDKKIKLKNSQEFNMSILSMGNPHAILQVASVDHFPVQEMGSQIATHDIFPQGINVGFMEVINPEHIRLRTYERGVGETLACGSNTCAAVVAGIVNKSLQNKVAVTLPLGQLQIEWQGPGHPVSMTGPAMTVFNGEFVISPAQD